MDKIKELREKLGISQAELANKINVVRSTICQYEKGTREPSYEVIQKLADFFNVSVDYLLGREAEKKDAPFEAIDKKRSDKVFRPSERCGKSGQFPPHPKAARNARLDRR